VDRCGEAFDAATTGGARLCGWGDRIGGSRRLPRRSSSTRSGATHYLPLNNCLQQIVYCEDGTGVESVMIAERGYIATAAHADRSRRPAFRKRTTPRWISREESGAARDLERLEAFRRRFCSGIRARFHAGACC